LVILAEAGLLTDIFGCAETGAVWTTTRIWLLLFLVFLDFDCLFLFDLCLFPEALLLLLGAL